MTKDEQSSPLRGGSIRANTLWNIGGAGIPLIVAVFAIPVTIAGLGTDRFGLLALAWTVIGYFGAFDLGLGVATTKFVAEFQQQGRRDAQRQLIAASAGIHLALGCAGGLLLAAITGWLLHDVLKVPPALMAETESAFYILALSIPVIVVTAWFRGALDGLHLFDLVNIVKVPASVANYISPVLVLWHTSSLAVIVATMVVIRLVVLVSYVWLTRNAIEPAARGAPASAGMMSALLRYGGWLSITNFVTPIMVSLDRFLIGAFVSASAVAYYVTPYEVITKLWILSAGLLAVLLPVFSALAVDSSADIRRVMRQAVRVLLAVAAPVIAAVLALGGDLLSLWVGEEFRQNSTIASRWIAIGILFNIAAQVPLTALHGIGRTDVTARIFCAELVFYALLAWLLVKEFGIEGVACAWAVRAGIDALVLFFVANQVLPGPQTAGLAPPLRSLLPLAGYLVAGLLVSLLLTQSLALRVFVTALIVTAMLLWEWRFLLLETERASLLKLRAQLHATIFTRGQP